MSTERGSLHEYDDEDLAVAAVVPGDVEAEVIVEVLLENGIQAVASGGPAASFRVGVPGRVPVLVHQDDLTRAKEIVTQASHAGERIDWSQVDVGEPVDE